MTAFIDEKDITLFSSPSGLRHVGAWFGKTVCGVFVDSHNGWEYGGLTSLRSLGRMSRSPKANMMCKRCANEYKDVEDK